jgi:hypothetical protein
MAARKQRDKQLLDHLLLTDNDLRKLGLDPSSSSRESFHNLAFAWRGSNRGLPCCWFCNGIH